MVKKLKFSNRTADLNDEYDKYKPTRMVRRYFIIIVFFQSNKYKFVKIPFLEMMFER